MSYGPHLSHLVWPRQCMFVAQVGVLDEVDRAGAGRSGVLPMNSRTRGIDSRCDLPRATSTKPQDKGIVRRLFTIQLNRAVGRHHPLQRLCRNQRSRWSQVLITRTTHPDLSRLKYRRRSPGAAFWIVGAKRAHRSLFLSQTQRRGDPGRVLFKWTRNMTQSGNPMSSNLVRFNLQGHRFAVLGDQLIGDACRCQVPAGSTFRQGVTAFGGPDVAEGVAPDEGSRLHRLAP